MAKKKLPLTDKQYLKNPSQCPACGGADITGGSVEVDGQTSWQEISCDNCGAKWNDIYKLVGYDELTVRHENIK